MNRLSVATLIGLVGLVATACSGSSADRVPDDPDAPASGALRRVASAADLEASIKSGFTTLQSPSAVAGQQPTDTSAFTGTYTQEPNVDEFDAVRYDGAYLYVAPQRFIQCCYILAGTQNDPPPPAPPVRAIRILSTDPANGSATEVGAIPLDDGVSVQGMYLTDGRLFALTSESFYGSYGDFWSSIAIWQPDKLGFQVYDTSDPASPLLQVEASIDGVFIESRRVGDTVYVISRYSPFIDGLVYPATTPAEQAQNEAVLNGVTLAELLPTIVVNGVARPLVDPERCYVTNDPSDPGYPIITSITAVPLNDPGAFRTTCYNEDAYGVYVSGAAIYVTQLRSDFALEQSFTQIHKFALTNAAPSYRGSGEVAGEVWRGGQADFRMNEQDDALRVIASQFDWHSDDFVDHRLYVLRESTTAPELEIVAALPNANRPEEIGKPNEALYGVRFIGTRAYVVTFEQIDPLYVIDLSDPADPKLAGTLEVSGFSDFLHPVSDDLLLGLGVAANGGVKLELFDVSDIDRPLSRGSAVLGGAGSYSEARSDRHAFTYQADVGGIDRFTIPADLYAEGTSEFVEAGLYLYEIRDKAMANLASLNAAGAIVTHRAGDGQPVSVAERNRAFIHDDTVYYIRDEQIWAAFWNAPSAPNGPF